MRVGDLVMVRESDSALHQDGKGELQHERYTGPWEYKKYRSPALAPK